MSWKRVSSRIYLSHYNSNVNKWAPYTAQLVCRRSSSDWVTLKVVKNNASKQNPSQFSFDGSVFPGRPSPGGKDSHLKRLGVIVGKLKPLRRPIFVRKNGNKEHFIRLLLLRVHPKRYMTNKNRGVSSFIPLSEATRIPNLVHMGAPQSVLNFSQLYWLPQGLRRWQFSWLMLKNSAND